MIKKLPSVDELTRLFIFDELRGRLVWRIRSDVANQKAWNTRYAGTDAGSQRAADGYLVVVIHGTKHLAHRIIWKMVTGQEPADILDHKNRNTSDNIFSNLREATAAQNMMNQRAWGKLPKGVYFHRKSKTYCARIQIHRKYKCLGYYKTAEKAAEVYFAAAIKYFGEFARAS